MSIHHDSRIHPRPLPLRVARRRRRPRAAASSGSTATARRRGADGASADDSRSRFVEARVDPGLESLLSRARQPGCGGRLDDAPGSRARDGRQPAVRCRRHRRDRRARARYRRVVFAGFSQGVAMAFRAACVSTAPVLGVIALGGDVPPELDWTALKRIPSALVGRGASDHVSGRRSGTPTAPGSSRPAWRPTSFSFDAGHEWNDVFGQRAGGFLTRLRA